MMILFTHFAGACAMVVNVRQLHKLGETVMITCTCCGCSYDVDGFYTQDDEPIMPCKICRCDQASIYYYNNAEAIRERRRKNYYANLEASREKDRNRKRQQKNQQPAQISVL